MFGEIDFALGNLRAIFVNTILLRLHTEINKGVQTA
jgi:hypothetical protein